MISKISILNKIKSLVRKTGHAVLWRGQTKENDISEKIAQKIQKNSYDISQRVAKDTFAPPYLELAEQLQVDEDQIFNAAVYNMTNIALVREKYRADILDIFKKFADDDSKSQEKREYVRKKMYQIQAQTHQ